MARPSDSLVDLYVLRDPATGEVRYAGKANDAAKRLKSHLHDCKSRNTPVYCWIRKLVLSGQCPTIEVVQRVTADEWKQAEIDLIARLRTEGARLLNVAIGGDQPSMTLEQRQDNGRKVAAQRQSDPVKRRIWEIKRAMGSYIKTGPKTARYYEIMAKLRMAAQKHPALFGQWANV